MGLAAVSSGEGSVAIGQGAVATRDGQISLGSAGSFVSVGDIAASTAAQSGPTDIVTIDSSGTLGRDVSVRPAIASLKTQTPT